MGHTLYVLASTSSSPLHLCPRLHPRPLHPCPCPHPHHGPSSHVHGMSVSSSVSASTSCPCPCPRRVHVCVVSMSMSVSSSCPCPCRVHVLVVSVSVSSLCPCLCPCPRSPSSHVRVVLKQRGGATGKGIARCAREDAGEGTAMDPHAGVVRWWRGEGGHGEGEDVGGKGKVSMPRGCEQVESKLKKKLVRKERREAENTYHTHEQGCGCGWTADTSTVLMRSQQVVSV